MSGLPEFEAVLAEVEIMTATFKKEQDEVQSGYEQALQALFKSKFPRSKFSVSACREKVHESAAVYDEWAAKAKDVGSRHEVERKAVDEKLNAMASGLSVPMSDKWELWTSVSSYSYSSQGFGACKYAKGSAESYADNARHNGIEVEVRAQKKDYGATDFEVWVKTTRTGIELLKRKDAVPLVEAVRLSWSRGVNPRVLNPWLPHGFEEAHGLNYFGGHVKKEAVPAADKGGISA